jgi:hypothetical protein
MTPAVGKDWTPAWGCKDYTVVLEVEGPEGKSRRGKIGMWW